jgi:hypothetical protein|tara:strand:+ start:10058 stop:10618 length:561 start_codon:yes stop_codon:yes gene_type:complete
MKRNNKHNKKKQDITLMTILANEATKESDELLKSYNKPKATGHTDLEDKLAQLYFELDDKLSLEKKMAEIHPHKNWIVRTLGLKSKGNIECSNCDWSWEKSKGGEDPYKCHKCGNQNNSKDKEIKTEIPKENVISDSIAKFSDFNGSNTPQSAITTNKSNLEVIGLVGVIGLIGLTFIIVSKNLMK